MQQGSKDALAKLMQHDALVRRFIGLTAYDTMARRGSKFTPSSAGQLRLGAHLSAELCELGLHSKQDEHGVVITKVPATEGCQSAPGLCLLAHLDTAPDASGCDIRPALVEKYLGQGVELENALTLDEHLSPELASHVGDDLIVTDGRTLLGADDKAGVAVLMELLKSCAADPGLTHGPLTVVFTCDEELGLSCQHLEVESLGCTYAVTLDGGDLGSLDVATFNAAGAVIQVQGRAVHTAVAKGRMVNAVGLCQRFLAELPAQEKPECSAGHEGFYHVHNLEAAVDQAKIFMILRDFEREGLLVRQGRVQGICAMLNEQLGYAAFEASIVPQYSNMADVLKAKPRIVELCRQAYGDCGVEVTENWVRGGTDGAILSARGLPCPNVFTGALNCHGPWECLSVQTLHKCEEVCRRLVTLAAAEVKPH